MQYTKTTHEGTCELIMSGQFTFSDNLTFRDMLDDVTKDSISSLIVDVSSIEFIDSAALGMFLLLRDFATKKHISLTLKQPQGQVKKIFDVSRFEQLFKII